METNTIEMKANRFVFMNCLHTRSVQHGQRDYQNGND
jgi:hypothetical protein